MQPWSRVKIQVSRDCECSKLIMPCKRPITHLFQIRIVCVMLFYFFLGICPLICNYYAQHWPPHTSIETWKENAMRRFHQKLARRRWLCRYWPANARCNLRPDQSERVQKCFGSRLASHESAGDHHREEADTRSTTSTSRLLLSLVWNSGSKQAWKSRRTSERGFPFQWHTCGDENIQQEEDLGHLLIPLLFPTAGDGSNTFEKFM